MDIFSGRVLSNALGDKLEFLVLYLFLLGFVAAPLSGVALAVILHHGQLTHFSSSDPRLGFVPGPTARGTLNIIWVCASTIFTSVYLSVHMDVPNEQNAMKFADALREGDFSRLGSTFRVGTLPAASTSHRYPPTVTDDPVDTIGVVAKPSKIPLLLRHCFAWLWEFTARPFFRRVLWTCFNVFAPELVIFVAVLEQRSARDALTFMHKRGQQGWTKQLAFFADMGGFQLEDGYTFRNGLEFMRWVDQKNVYFSPDDTHQSPSPLRAIKREVDDRCKTNTVLKVFTCTQAAWLFVETAIRLGEGKAVSELEIATCSYIFCALITYMFWLKKPYDVRHPVVLREKWFSYDRPVPRHTRSNPSSAPTHHKRDAPVVRSYDEETLETRLDAHLLPRSGRVARPLIQSLQLPSNPHDSFRFVNGRYSVAEEH